VSRAAASDRHRAEAAVDTDERAAQPERAEGPHAVRSARLAAFAIVAVMDRPSPVPQAPAARQVPPISAWWLGRTGYRDAWDLQHRLVAARAAGLIGDQLLLLEHEPVLTLGRHSDPSHVIAGSDELAARHIELIRVERGGEVTYHGPGQLTAYPIVKLADRGLLVRPMVRALEAGLIAACAEAGVEAGRRDGFPGCWCGVRKIGAVGIRIERGVSYHGIALNVTVSLADFELIDACGMPGVQSTSIARELGLPSEPSTESVGRGAAAFALSFADQIGAPLLGTLPPAADAAAARADLEGLLAARAGSATATVGGAA
jgi:lipoyl(octanoyl) transferase